MKVTVLQTALQEAMTYVSKGMSSNASMPILTGVLLKTENAALELQTSCLDSSVKYLIPAEVIEEGATVVPASLFLNMIKSCPDEPISVESDELQLRVSCGTLSYTLPTLPAEDFPTFPSFEPDHAVELPAPLFFDMAEKVYNVASTDTSHPILTGVYIEIENNTLRLVATDSFRLAITETHVDTASSESLKMVVNSRQLHSALSLGTKEEKVLIGVGETQVSFVFGNATFVCKQIEGNFPNYQQLLPKEIHTSVQVDRQALQETLKHVSVVSPTTPSVKVVVDTDANLLTLATHNVSNESAQESLEATCSGNAIEIGLNPRYMGDCLSATSDVDTLTLEMTEPVQPAVFKTSGTTTYLYLLMPMRL